MVDLYQLSVGKVEIEFIFSFDKALITLTRRQICLVMCPTGPNTHPSGITSHSKCPTKHFLLISTDLINPAINNTGISASLNHIRIPGIRPKSSYGFP